DRPPHGRRPREMSAACLEACLPRRQEQLEVSGSEVTDASLAEPVVEVSQRVGVLPSGRVGATAPAKVTVEALEELFDLRTGIEVTAHVVDSITVISGAGFRLAWDEASAA